MFDIGFWEMAFIGAVALVVIGPERLPGFARATGHWVGKGRRMLNEVKSDIRKEIREQELHELKDLKQELGSVASDFRKASDNPDILGLKETGKEIRESMDDVSGGPKKKTAAKKATAKKTASSVDESVDEIVKSEQTKSAKIRQLWEKGCSRGDIARHLGLSYQHVRSALIGSKGLVRPADDGVRKMKKSG